MSEPEGGASGSFVYMVDESERGEPRELYSLFRGAADAQGAHVAMRDVRHAGDAIWARPWRSGVSVGLRPSGGGQTTELVDSDGLLFLFEQESDGEQMLVYGLVADHVVAVDVIGPAGPIRARLENNAYAALLDAKLEDQVTVRLHRADGSSFQF